MLLLIDTFYFLHRSFHAYPKDLTTSSGEYTNVVFGLAQSLLDIISELNPTYIACAWESEDQPSFRKELYPLYQITRVPMEPEDEKVFASQFDRIIELLEAFSIPRLTQNGFEGDDILGTVATLAADSVDVVIATADKDMLQLINDKISVFRPANPPFVKKVLLNKFSFIENYQFAPTQMIDYKALRGDPSDNIPGVKGIGDKGARKLLAQFARLEDIYENLDKIDSKSIKEKLEKDKENAFISKQLATIITNVPIEFNLSRCIVHDFDMEEVRRIFSELEFTSLIKKLDNLEKVKIIKEKLKEKKVSQESQLNLF